MLTVGVISTLDLDDGTLFHCCYQLSCGTDTSRNVIPSGVISSTRSRINPILYLEPVRSCIIPSPIEVSVSIKRERQEFLLLVVLIGYRSRLSVPYDGFDAQCLTHVTSDEVMCVYSTIEIEVQLPALIIRVRSSSMVESVGSI